MMCTNCGSSVPDGSAFCPVCGMPAASPAPGQAPSSEIAPYQGDASGAAPQQPAAAQASGAQGFGAWVGASQGYAGHAYAGQADYAGQQGCADPSGYTGPQGHADPSAYAAAGGPYTGSYMPQPPVGGSRALNDKRSMLMVLLLNIVTCGIFWYIALHEIAEDMNAICEGDREETPGIVVFIVLSYLTGGLYTAWWYYKLGNRMQRNAPRYGLSFKENGTTLLIWNYAGCILCCAGPIIATNIIVKNANALAAAYNARCGLVYQS